MTLVSFEGFYANGISVWLCILRTLNEMIVAFPVVSTKYILNAA